MPSAAIVSRFAPRTKNVTSSPALASRAPTKPPMAPAPITATFIVAPEGFMPIGSERPTAHARIRKFVAPYHDRRQEFLTLQQSHARAAASLGLACDRVLQRCALRPPTLFASKKSEVMPI